MAPMCDEPLRVMDYEISTLFVRTNTNVRLFHFLWLNINWALVRSKSSTRFIEYFEFDNIKRVILIESQIELIHKVEVSSQSVSFCEQKRFLFIKVTDSLSLTRPIILELWIVMFVFLFNFSSWEVGIRISYSYCMVILCFLSSISILINNSFSSGGWKDTYFVK